MSRWSERRRVRAEAITKAHDARRREQLELLAIIQAMKAENKAMQQQCARILTTLDGIKAEVTNGSS